MREGWTSQSQKAPEGLSAKESVLKITGRSSGERISYGTHARSIMQEFIHGVRM